MQVMNEHLAKTLQRIDSVKSEIEGKIDNISGKIDNVKAELEGKIESVSRDVNSFKAECASMYRSNEDAIRTLDDRVDGISEEIGSLANRNDLIVSGIPYIENENLNSYFAAMWNYVGLPTDIIPAVDIRRLKAGPPNQGLILMQFGLRNKRDDFFRGYLRKRDLQLSHLGINSPRRVYIDENLTTGARKIKAVALQLKKAGKLSTVYTKMGVVHVKRPTDELPTVIRNEQQLQAMT